MLTHTQHENINKIICRNKYQICIGCPKRLRPSLY